MMRAADVQNLAKEQHCLSKISTKQSIQLKEKNLCMEKALAKLEEAERDTRALVSTFKCLKDEKRATMEDFPR